MRQDVCMFFFVISLLVFVSNLEGLFLFFQGCIFRFLWLLFRDIIYIEFSPFHYFVDIFLCIFGVEFFLLFCRT